jgi:metal-responsive CopG/Arc/MetJ family transcriptional regulator
MKDIGQPRGLDNGHTILHTNGMKIAISIPDSVFRDVRKAAEEQKRSRSEVIVEAVREYLRKLDSRRMMAALDAVYAAPETAEEKAARQAALDLYKRTVLEKEEW